MEHIKLKHINFVKQAIDDRISSKPVVITVPHSLFSGINNVHTEFPFRIAYAMWILRGSNLLEPLKYYSNCMNELTDDGKTLRGAYGPRMRFWIGADALQEAININTDISEPEDFVKPVGIDQLEAIYRDLESGMNVGTITIQDPAIDFEETMYVPDLHSVTFLRLDDELEMVMNYPTVDVLGHMLNDVWAFEFIKWILATFLDLTCGKTTISVCRPVFSTSIVADFGKSESLYEHKKLSVVPQNIDNKSLFWEEFDVFQEFEKHLRMQINHNTFRNEKINIAELSQLLDKKLLSKMKTQVMLDLGYSLLVSALVKYSDNLKIYDNFIGEIMDKISVASFIVDLLEYSKYRHAYHELTSFQKISDDFYG